MADDRNLRRAIRADEALSLGLLRYANSAWLARRQRVRTIDEALAVVGLDGVRSLVITDFVARFFSDWGAVEEFLWEHALASGIAAALQRPGGGRATEELYLCGLLHNVGKAALNAHDRASYARVVARVIETGEEFAEAEQAILGVNHTAVGRELLEEAAVSPIVKQTAAYHHQPLTAPSNVLPVCNLLLIADAMAYRASSTWAALCKDSPAPAWIDARLGANRIRPVPASLIAHEQLVRSELQRMRSLFGVNREQRYATS